MDILLIQNDAGVVFEVNFLIQIYLLGTNIYELIKHVNEVFSQDYKIGRIKIDKTMPQYFEE